MQVGQDDLCLDVSVHVLSWSSCNVFDVHVRVQVLSGSITLFKC